MGGIALAADRDHRFFRVRAMWRALALLIAKPSS
jgi:hypothetical protein